MNEDRTMQDSNPTSEGFTKTEDFVTFTIAGQLFGIPVLKVQDILSVRPGTL